MILYELAANAVKHSVLGQRLGTLEIIVESLGLGRAYVQWIERLDRPRGRPDGPATSREGSFDEFALTHCLAKMNATLVQNEITQAEFSFIFEFDTKTDFTLALSGSAG